MAHTHSIYDTDKHFSIDPVTRKLTSENQKNTVVQYYHNSERFTFELPRYIEGHDMSLCDRVEVHYLNFNSANKTESSGVYEVEDLQFSPADKEVVICSWLISQNVTKYDGSLSFLVRFACTDDTGKLTYAWNTIPYTAVSVSKGLYNSEAVEAEYADVLAQWEQRLFGINDDGVQNVTEAQAAAVAAVEAKAQEVLETIPDDYKTLDQNVTEYKATMANAIKGTMTGAVVRADDVSPVEHEMAVRVRSADGAAVDLAGVTVTRCGKNLLPYPFHNTTVTVQGATYTDNGDGSITVSGTPTEYGSITLYKGKPLVRSGYIVLSGMTGVENVLFTMNINYEGDITESLEFSKPSAINLDDYPGATQWNLGIKRWANNVELSGTAFPQIEVGNVATRYEPYIGTTYTPLSDGTVTGITSLSPTTTLLTDTPGAIVECEYNCDTNKVIADILDKIAALNA